VHLEKHENIKMKNRRFRSMEAPFIQNNTGVKDGNGTQENK
jgi:hypothetical protein